ncbi:outer envelope pore protein 37, chloroplastic-like [Phalaenopsis equestris]|uniref:outer envelope pore protein 37, chloroplastic-like n=1 Tax=Phalaenopsis equestris TaxID=78828 RepID=UPI0009E4857F|nr:outer envelope pore protein 37, chloroplastic-like [Phalaenopsis equestris]
MPCLHIGSRTGSEGSKTANSYRAIEPAQPETRAEQLGAGSMIATLPNPSVKLELSSSVPLNGLPRAALHFPYGEIALEQRENIEEKDEVRNALSVDGILKSPLLNGVSTVVYNGKDLNLRYIYKDTHLTFIPSFSLPSNKASFAFKRRFSSTDKLRNTKNPILDSLKSRPRGLNERENKSLRNLTTAVVDPTLTFIPEEALLVAEEMMKQGSGEVPSSDEASTMLP